MAEGQQEKIVYHALKVDLHIHSSFSQNKDGNLVKNGTVENLSKILFPKLLAENIEAFAITDHDNFSYSFYNSAKGESIKPPFCFKKVFPGVEFSVGYKPSEKVSNANSDGFVQVHVITIFDDANEVKLQTVESIINEKVNSSGTYQKYQFFSEPDFKDILSQIGLSVVLIAHQKGSPLGSPSGQDATVVGEERYDEFLNAEYFEAFEFGTATNALFHRLFQQEKNRDNDVIRYIMGSDCHEWGVYPRHDSSIPDKSPYNFAFLKCLPTFRGLAMALTDDTRINTQDNFFAYDPDKLDDLPSNNRPLSSLSFSINGINDNIPLSLGINAIIGDNSVGKSFLLHALTNYYKFDTPDAQISPELKTGYKKYALQEGFKINETLTSSKIFAFDAQGEIRKRFESGENFLSKFIEEKYPSDPDYSIQEKNLNESIDAFCDKIRDRLANNELMAQLKSVSINVPAETETDKNLQASVVSETAIDKSLDYRNAEICFKNIDESIEKLELNPSISVEDKNELIKIKSAIDVLREKYSVLEKSRINRNELLSAIRNAISNYSVKLSVIKTNIQKAQESFCTDVQNLADMLFKINGNPDWGKVDRFSLLPFDLQPSCSFFGDVCFVKRCKVNLKHFDNAYLERVLSSCIHQGKTFPDFSSLTIETLNGLVTNKDDHLDKNGADLLRAKMKEKIHEDLLIEKQIVKSDADVTLTYSSGKNSTIYFELIVGDANTPGIYLVDQPEDDVSQTSIRKEIIKGLQQMRKKRQIILITHNPQFVVNLDVDNVIFVKKDSNSLSIENGALEFSSSDCDILKIVSENLDGGVDSLKKRWKRYEKSIAAEKN